MLSQDANSQDADAAEVVWAKSSPGIKRSLVQVGLKVGALSCGCSRVGAQYPTCQAWSEGA